MTRRLSLASLLVLTSALAALAQMPDVSQMSGVPLPSGELPNGTVSIRVVRGALGNDVVGLEVELHGGGQVWKVTTDGEGRAQFAQAAPGTRVHAVATVDGVRLESEEFPVPATGGMRVIIVAPLAGNAGATPPAAAPATPLPPAAPGTVVLGGQSRFVVEMADEAVDVYCLFEIANAGAAPVSIEAPLAFEVPEGAVGLTMLEGSSPQATAAGRIVTVNGPFNPGITQVQFAYQYPYSSGSLTLSQTLPVALAQTSVVAHKLGEVTLASPQLANAREVPLEGKTYIMASGPGVAAGQPVTFTLDGLPHRSRVPRYTTLALVIGIVGWGIWLAMGTPQSSATDRSKLEGRREQLLNELVRLEEQHQLGKGEPSRYTARRRDLVQQLERIYAELDDLPGEASVSRAVGTAAAPAR